VLNAKPVPLKNVGNARNSQSGPTSFAALKRLQHFDGISELSRSRRDAPETPPSVGCGLIWRRDVEACAARTAGISEATTAAMPRMIAATRPALHDRSETSAGQMPDSYGQHLENSDDHREYEHSPQQTTELRIECEVEQPEIRLIVYHLLVNTPFSIIKLAI